MRPLATQALASLAAVLLTTGASSAETLSMWARADTQTFLTELVNAYNAAHENQVELQIVPNNEIVQKYATAAAGGSAPDVLSLDLIYVPAFAAAGQLEDITELAQSFEYFEYFSPAHVRLGTYEDRIYGLPFYADGSIMFWNKDLFEQAGLDPERGPTSWAEIRDYAERVNALGGDVRGYYFSGNCPPCNAFTFLPLVWASGGDIFSEDGRTATLDTPEMRDAITLYRGLVEDGLVPQGSQSDNGSGFVTGFASGNVGMSPVGAFMIGVLNNDYPEINYGVTLIPGQEGGASSFSGGDNFVVTAGRTDKLPAVREFLEFAYSLEQQTMLASYGNLPLRADIAEEALSQVDPRYTIAASALAVGRAPYTTVYNDLINSASSPWALMINEVFFGEDVDESLAYAQETMQAILDGTPE